MAAGAQLLRKGFAVGPGHSTSKVLLLPDGNSALERVDGKTAGIEGRSTMRGGHYDQHAGFPDLQPAQTVNNRNLPYLVVGQHLLRKRIHLAERGHPVCGEKVYNRQRGGEPVPDSSGAPRLALHAAELGFTHPATDEAMRWTMPLPPDLDSLLKRLRRGKDADQVD